MIRGRYKNIITSIVIFGFELSLKDVYNCSSAQLELQSFRCLEQYS